jgi:ribonuclease P protein component
MPGLMLRRIVKKTLRKPEKLRFKAEFDQVRLNGKKLVGTAFLAVCAPSPDGLTRCGVICSRKYSLLAVKRNRARRLLWESFRLLKEYMPACHMILIPRRKMEKRKRQEVTRELAALLAKENQLPQEIAALPPEC